MVTGVILGISNGSFRESVLTGGEYPSSCAAVLIVRYSSRQIIYYSLEAMYDCKKQSCEPTLMPSFLECHNILENSFSPHVAYRMLAQS